METTNTNTPTIGPVASGLLAALRAFETAVNHYYTAVWPERNPDTPDGEPGEGLTPEEVAAFDTAKGIIERQIRARILWWANTTNPNEPI